MSALLTFDTQNVRPWNQPTPDTSATLDFHTTFLAPPQLPVAFTGLDIANSGNIRAKSTLDHVTDTDAVCHITSWSDTTLYSGVVDVLALGPGDVEYQTGTHMRDVYSNPNDPASVRVDFDHAFVTPPKVVSFLNLIDLDKNYNWRLYTNVSQIDEKGFTLNIDTWGDTVLHGAQAGWIAYPADRDDIFSTSVNTLNVVPQTTNTSVDVQFDPIKFCDTPSVFVGLNEIDFNSTSNLRINAFVDSVHSTGAVWHVTTWGDTQLNSAGLSIIAFD